MTLDVLLAARDDWANIGYIFEQSLKAVGLDALAVTQNPHGFHYTKQARKYGASEILKIARTAKTVVNMHSVKVIPNTKVQRYGVFHGGTPYRLAPAALNAVFNPFCDFTLIQTDDLLGYGAKNEEWCLPAVDLDMIRPKIGIFGNKIKIAHHPRSAPEKGAPAINGVMDRMKSGPLASKFDYLFNSKLVTWPESIARMGECDIYIEILAPTHHGKRHGVWGVTALEAAALGKIVVTNFNGLPRYLKEYGPCGLHVANTPAELEATLSSLLQMSTDELESLQAASREWAEKFHSYKALGERLKKIISRRCKPILDASGEPIPVSAASFSYDPAPFWEVYGCKLKLAGVAFVEEMSSLIDLLNRDRLLDKQYLEVGQGIGLTYLGLRSRGYELKNYRAVDFVQCTRNKFRQSTGVMPDYWDGKKLPYEDNSFEYVLSCDVMQYVPSRDVVKFLKEHVRVAKVGMIVTATVNVKAGINGGYSGSHDFDTLFAQCGLTVVKKKMNSSGDRALWLLAKTRKVDGEAISATSGVTIGAATATSATVNAQASVSPTTQRAAESPQTRDNPTRDEPQPKRGRGRPRKRPL